MIRPPPSSTLFPSPTLSRSQDRAHRDHAHAVNRKELRALPAFQRQDLQQRINCDVVYYAEKYPRRDMLQAKIGRRENAFGISRSEEHTSELQSHLNLVCRLL